MLKIRTYDTDGTLSTKRGHLFSFLIALPLKDPENYRSAYLGIIIHTWGIYFFCGFKNLGFFWNVINPSRHLENIRENLPPRKFTSDGCSGSFSKTWKKLFNKLSPFEMCCLCHDIEYHYGSGNTAGPLENFKERLKVDNEFFLCLWRTGTLGKLFAPFMWLAVRLGGGGYLNKSFSWGFGWRE